jgi:hypothetical protein
MVTTPHFYDNTGSTSPATVAATLATAMVTYLGSPYQGYVKIYVEDYNPAGPHIPLANASFGNAGNFAIANGPRELALVLSYFSGQNTKRWRGRLYIPLAWFFAHMVAKPNSVAERPTPGELVAVMDFATVVLHSCYAQGWQWCVASQVDKTRRLTTDYWCNDEWDVIRSRGLRETTRQTAKFP